MKTSIVILLSFLLSNVVYAQSETGNQNNSRQKVTSTAPTLSGQWFLSVQEGDTDGKEFSQFCIKRGYITIKKRLSDRISGRITPDICVDREGDGEGDLEMRLKFCYIDLKLDRIGFLTQPHFEFGLVHRPWLNFEAHINRYRMQGTTFLERNKIFNSCDFGITFFSHLGGELDEDLRKNVHDKYAGKYGSFAIGIHNGGGYHAIEQNTNKTVETRLTIRPAPMIAPGFQLSYLNIFGKGNTQKSPDWTLNALFASLEQHRYILTGTYYKGAGNNKGSALDADGDALQQSGFSFFGEMKLFSNKYSLIGRYDQFDDQVDDGANDLQRIIAGVAYHIQGNTRVLVDYDISYRDSLSDYIEATKQVTVEYNF